MSGTTANKVAGFNGTLTINGTDYQVTKWDGTVTQDKLESTNMASLGWKESFPGLKGFEGSFEAIYDSVLNSGGAPFTVSTPASFSLTTGSGRSITFTGIVYKQSFGFDVGGAATISADFEATGVVTFN